jgi:hypothetical protein
MCHCLEHDQHIVVIVSGGCGIIYGICELAAISMEYAAQYLRVLDKSS